MTILLILNGTVFAANVALAILWVATGEPQLAAINGGAAAFMAFVTPWSALQRRK